MDCTYVYNEKSIIVGISNSVNFHAYADVINPKATDKQLLSLARWRTIIFAYTCLLPAMIIPSASLTTLFLTLVYGVTCPFSFAIIFGMLWKKVTTNAAF